MRTIYFKRDLTKDQKFLLLTGIIEHRLSGKTFEEVDAEMYLADGMSKDILEEFRPMIEKLIAEKINM